MERKLTAIRSFARWCGIPELLRNYRLPTPPAPQPHPLPGGLGDVRKMMNVCVDENEQSLIVLCGLMGLRVAEALHVRPSHFDMKKMTLSVLGKGSKTRILPIRPEVWSVLCGPVAAAYLAGADERILPYEDRVARRKVTSIGQRARLSRPVASHDLRMTFATAVYDRTKDIRAVQLLLGHADPKITTLYIGRDAETMREAADLS